MSKERTRTVEEDATAGSAATGDPAEPEAGETGTAAADPGDVAVDDPEDAGGVEPADVSGEHDEVTNDRYRVGLALALVAGGGGLLLNSPALFLSATVGLAYAVYGYATRPPSSNLLVTRDVGDASPLPGDRVEVTVTVENVGERSVPDLRVVDDVPRDLPVVEGTPSHATSLKPGDDTEYTYALRARRGTHEFGGTTVVSRNLSGTVERRKRADNERTVACQARLEGLPLESLTIPFTGRVETDSGGDGLEFWSTRKYTHGDPMRRIDWNRYARTNELTTIVYRETEAATVVVMVDDRSESKVVRRSGEPDSLELCRHAGQLVADTLIESNNRVGVAMYGDGTYLTQGGGQAQKVRIDRLLEEGPGSLRSDDKHVHMAYGGEHATTLRRHFPENAQVVFVTPLLDDQPHRIAEGLRAHGHPVTVVSPDMTLKDSPGGIVARVERNDRIRTIRRNGSRVVDWSPDDPLEVAVQRALERWSR